MSEHAQRVAALRAAKQSQLDPARPDAVERVHGTGKLTARERLERLLADIEAIALPGPLRRALGELQPRHLPAWGQVPAN